MLERSRVRCLRLQVEWLERDALRCDQEFTAEGRFGGAPAEGLFGGNGCRVGIVILLRHMGEDQIARSGVESLWVCQIFTDGEVRQVAGTRQNTLLDGPRVRTDFEHVQIVIGFENQAVGLAQMHFDVIRHIPKIGADSNLCAVGPKSERHRVDGIMGNTKCVNIDITDRKTLTGLNGLHAAKTLAKRFGKNAPEGSHGGFGHIEGSFPETEGLRKAVAVVRVFVRDQDSVQVVKFQANGGEAGKSFALSQAGVNKDAGAFGFEQCRVARTAGRENGDAQTD